MSNVERQIALTKEKLATVSSSFCLAKWKQVTIHLHNGLTHSCHHPIPHKIPLSEIQKNPSALHNTLFKKQQRALMMNGKRPNECDYCWRVEDTQDGSQTSDRFLKSQSDWAAPYFEEVRSQSWDQDINPSYLEVSFSSTCNFKCAYCGPAVSSKWMEEIKQHGHYSSTGHHELAYLQKTGQIPIPESEHNPYTEAFWKWWPTLAPSLRVFRITGGEPLLSRHTFRVLDHFLEHPNPELELAVNSNLGVPRNLILTFIEKARTLLEKKAVKKLQVFTSIDTWGEQAEYIRFGLNHKTYWENVQQTFESIPGLELIFMCTLNALSIPRFPELIRKVAELKRTAGLKPDVDRWRICLDTSYLRFPDHFTVQVLPKDFVPTFEGALEAMEAESPWFSAEEILKVRRILDWFKSTPESEQLTRMRRMFYLFFKEYDERRGTDFLKTFPELRQFWFDCEKLTQGPIHVG